MKTVFRLTLLSVLLGLAVTAFPRQAFAGTTPDEMHISCTAPNPAHQTGLHRPKGDGDIWIFQIVLDGDASFVDGPHWSYPGKNGNDPDWGLITGGADGDTSMGWSSPGETGDFQVRVNGQIVCGDGGDGAPIDFSAGWDGKVEYNAEIKVRRKDSGDDYSSSATVAVGSKNTSEHQADVKVIATDDEGNPMESISVDAPTIQNKEGVETDASISPSSATTNSNGEAFFTFTSSDILGSVTLEADGGESSASANITENWTEDLTNGNWEYEPYFDYGVSSPITFKMALNADGSIPITNHDIHFVTTKVSGWKWNPNSGEDWDSDGSPDGAYEHVPLQDYATVASQYGNLVVYGDGETEGVADKDQPDPGSYTVQQKVSSNNNFWVDEIHFDAVDHSAF